MAADPLLTALSQPGSLAALGAAEWDRLLPRARRAGLLARLDALAGERGLLDRLPPQARAHLTAARAGAEQSARMARWEVNRIRRALADVETPFLLLKGAAYVVAGLPAARGRRCSDVDILVPRARLDAVEAALARHGWEPAKLHAYDQQYYRRWMHELPPLRHKERFTVVDVHHTILPDTSRRPVDGARLLGAARRLGDPGLFVLAPADMVLHVAAHMFQDGTLDGSLRELVDIDDLLRHFAEEPGFWERLVQRGRQLGLERPVFYALHYAAAMLATPVPRSALEAARTGRSARAVLWVMDALVPRALLPDGLDGPRAGAGLARWLLYVRSHWLRMPPLLLARHLLRKSVRRWAEPAAA